MSSTPQRDALKAMCLKAGLTPLAFVPVRNQVPEPPAKLSLGARSLREIREMVERLEDKNTLIVRAATSSTTTARFHRNTVLLCALRWTLGADSMEMEKEY